MRSKWWLQSPEGRDALLCCTCRLQFISAVRPPSILMSYQLLNFVYCHSWNEPHAHLQFGVSHMYNLELLEQWSRKLTPFFPTPYSVMQHWYLRISLSGSIYTAEIGKYYKSELFGVCFQKASLSVHHTSQTDERCVTHLFSQSSILSPTIQSKTFLAV